jgi:uncharacterized membrane protein HdeD (DUF308 family)
MKQRDKKASKRPVLFGRTILSRREWLISHGFIFFGLICISIAIYLTYEPPISNLLMFGLWFLFGGICYVVSYLARRLIDK